jgi:hypothetical protein
MKSNPSASKTSLITGLSNQEFLERFAQPGAVGLSGGVSLVDKAICRAERHLDPRHRWSIWSHAFVFQGRRADGHHWVIESDLQLHRKHIRLGVQENRITKYFDENLYTTLAVLDFRLSDEQVQTVLGQGLELVASHTQYSLRELFGTLLALRRPQLRQGENLLARDGAAFCSAFVQYLFRKAGLDLTPGVDDKHTTPEDISRTNVPHVTYLLQRQTAHSRLGALGKRVERRVKARARLVRRRVRGE